MTQYHPTLPILTRRPQTKQLRHCCDRCCKKSKETGGMGKACQQLQKPVILLRLFFTGFEPIQQNQVIVGQCLRFLREGWGQCDRTIQAEAAIFVRVAPAHPVRTAAAAQN